MTARNDLEDRAILRLIKAHGPMSCVQVTGSVSWRAGPTLIRLERAGKIEWVTGGYQITEQGVEAAGPVAVAYTGRRVA